MITIIICDDIEAAMFAAITAENELEFEAFEQRQDRTARLLLGSCDICQEGHDLALVELGGLAVCAACLAASEYIEAVEFGQAPGEIEL